MAPTLLLQLLVLQPFALAVLDADVRGHRPTLRHVMVRPFTNPLTIGTLIGLLLSVTGWTLPPIVPDPVELIGAMAVPGMLLAYGIALRLGPGFGGEVPGGELALTSALKLGVQPLVAYAVAHLALGLSGPALLAVVVCSSLPTAQNIFVHATRYDRSPTLARDTILVTTVGAVRSSHSWSGCWGEHRGPAQPASHSRSHVARSGATCVKASSMARSWWRTSSR